MVDLCNGISVKYFLPFGCFEFFGVLVDLLDGAFDFGYFILLCLGDLVKFEVGGGCFGDFGSFELFDAFLELFGSLVALRKFFCDFDVIGSLVAQQKERLELIAV